MRLLQDVLDSVLESLPLPELQPAGPSPSGGREACGADATSVKHSACLWFFVARCDTDMPGRAEHTDTIEHDGTWHYQLRGKKRWYIRPTEELLARTADELEGASTAAGVAEGKRLVVDCGPGDVLLINTQLWWHQTEIPRTTHAPGQLSISYARDVFLSERPAASQEAEEEAEEEADCTTDMGNRDQFRVEGSIEEGDVIFPEDDLPEVSLPASKTPNCQYIVWEPTGGKVVVALRDIEEGECLTVPESAE